MLSVSAPCCTPVNRTSGCPCCTPSFATSEKDREGEGRERERESERERERESVCVCVWHAQILQVAVQAHIHANTRARAERGGEESSTGEEQLRSLPRAECVPRAVVKTDIGAVRGLHVENPPAVRQSEETE